MQIILSFLAGIVLFRVFRYFPHLTISFGILAAGWLFTRKQSVCVLMCALGIVYAFQRIAPDHDTSSFGRSAKVWCAFQTYPEKTEKGYFRQKALIRSASDPLAKREHEALAGREVIILSDREFTMGNEYALAVTFLQSNTRLNPGSYVADLPYARASEVFMERAGSPSIQVRLERCRHRLHAFLTENFGKDSGALLAAITIGRRAEVSEKLREAFNTTGLAHILSISGTHFGLFSVFLYGIFRIIIGLLPYSLLQRISLYLTPAQAAAAFSLPFMIAYLGLSGGTIPAIRSFIMIGLFLFGLIIGRKGFWLNSLLFAALVIALWDPDSMFSLSFQLSFLAVLFIGFTIGQTDPGEKESRLRRYLKNSILLTLSASLGTAPLVAYSFHYASLLSPLANFVVAPIIGFILIPLSVMSAFVFLIAGYYPFQPVVASIANASVAIIQMLSEIPYADIKIASFPPIVLLLVYVGFFLFFSVRRRWYVLLTTAVCVLCIMVFSNLKKHDLAVTFLDVGQGDAAVVESPDGETIVVDTGLTGREVVNFLQYRGKREIDALLLSHLHPDHTGGLQYIRERFPIRRLWHSNALHLPDETQFPERRALERGDVIHGKGYHISVLHPYPEYYTAQGNAYVHENNESLVIRLSGRDSAFLFAGDAEGEAEEDMMHLGQWLKSDVLKVPHHGGRTSAHEPFFHLVDPEIAVISVEKNNRFGHPHQETLDVLSGRKILRTDVDGAVGIKHVTGGYEITTYRDFQFEHASDMGTEIKNIRRLFRRW